MAAIKIRFMSWLNDPPCGALFYTGGKKSWTKLTTSIPQMISWPINVYLFIHYMCVNCSPPASTRVSRTTTDENTRSEVSEAYGTDRVGPSWHIHTSFNVPVTLSSTSNHTSLVCMFLDWAFPTQSTGKHLACLGVRMDLYTTQLRGLHGRQLVKIMTRVDNDGFLPICDITTRVNLHRIFLAGNSLFA